ncbi:HNHc domain containing protein [uncultured Caudovirales phage]|uniref:HNHc domain containing protein n=1 Tax=uncultured Caudovirales phage TaxID=2100421 RepID=A0A6J5N8A2_9CAUD|nr:HNHc domain containing protein [uncultured Caudovirales phage]
MNRFKGDGNYYESHHIIPRWKGGNNSKSNLVLLTAREHYLAHYLLFILYKDRPSSAAFHKMNNTINNEYVDAKRYEELRKFQSEQWRGENNPAKRPEIRKKISEKLSGKNNPMFGKTGKQNPFFGKTHSKEHNRKKQILFSNKVEIYKDNILIYTFECTTDCGDFFKCTRKNITFRNNKPPAKFGIFKDLIVKICQ